LVSWSTNQRANPWQQWLVGSHPGNSDTSALQNFQQRSVKLEDKFEESVNGSAHQILAPVAEKLKRDEIRKRGGFSVRALLN
jgi:hypothetical protein